MKSYLLTAIVLLTCLQSEAADSLNTAWQKASKYFQQKQYDSAIVYYESLADRQISNPELYYNLGNAYYKANKIGPAVLNYERALQINPDYREAQDNLTLTQSRIANRIQEPQDIFFVSWWKSLTKQSLAGTWSVISLVLFLLTLLIVLLRKWYQWPGWLQAQIPVLSAVLFFLALFFAYVSSQRQVRQDEAVVMAADTPFRQDSKTTKTQSLVPEGTVVELETEQADWAKVRLPDGRTGYIQKDALEKI
jgi:tetratricopeptide (TPR) repeat protein